MDDIERVLKIEVVGMPDNLKQDIRNQFIAVGITSLVTGITGIAVAIFTARINKKAALQVEMQKIMQDEPQKVVQIKK